MLSLLDRRWRTLALGSFNNPKPMITLNVFVRVKPEHREELLEVGRTLFDALAKEPTFIDAWINAAVDQPDLVVVYERWNETKESFVQNIIP